MVFYRKITSAAMLFLLVFTVAASIPVVVFSQDIAEEKTITAKEAKEMIDNTVWKVELKEMSTEKNREEMKDILRFSEGKIASDKMVSEGFAATNFTVRIKGKDRVIWETMQTSEKNGIAFWRGELREGQPMRGVLSWHIKENKVKDYSFAGDGSNKWGPDGVVKEKPAPVEPVVQEEIITEEVIAEAEGDSTVQEQTEQEMAVIEAVVEEAPVPVKTEEKPEKRSKKSKKKR
ncbi:MAG: hypothetical protein KKG84_02615 [Candidatus Omnitrophica bacterium]|nr:hypothetical protein [Candidatus Omnitrophota bacterium]